MATINRAVLRSLVKQAVAAQLTNAVGKMLTIQDIAARLQFHERTFRRRREQLKFPAPLINHGNFVRWTEGQFNDWKNSCQTKRGGRGCAA